MGLSLLLCLILIWSIPDQPVQAATLLVTKTQDTNDGVCNQDCSLREAIAAAASGDTIRFSTDLLDSTLVLNGNSLVVDKNLTIIGHGAKRLTISGNQQSRVFHIRGNTTVTIRGLRIQDGFVSQRLDEPGGGGILNQGVLVLEDIHLTGNRVVDDGGGAEGGGIHNDRGVLSVSNATLNGNIVEDSGESGCFGAGISTTGNADLYNVTISENRAVDNGNWCFGAGIDHTEGDLILNFVTIVDNVGEVNGGQVFGGGISSAFGLINLKNTIIARNTPQNCQIVDDPDSDGYNLEDANTCGFPQTTNSTDLVNSNPRLDSLKDNGGSLLTHAILENSPLINRIPNGINDCQAGILADARGAVRANGDNRGGSGCEPGAYEYASSQMPTGVTVSGVQARPVFPLYPVAGVFLGALLVVGLRMAFSRLKTDKSAF
jgi:CSLREA domain-containing protein